ncbi:MAG: hypothetical protein HY304_02395 [candidate division Zixibacteria bacterium]|nr:hypothetical protein [candidate division Zixibacteria bacterium]
MRRWIGLGAALLWFTATGAQAAGLPHAGPRSANAEVIDNSAYFDGNSLLMFVTNTGSFAYDKSGLLGKNDGLYFPKGTGKTVIFAAGFWMGAKVDHAIRTSAAEYANDYVPGPMANGTYQTDQGRFRVYKIKRGDTRDNSGDYRDWPFEDGAPALKNDLGADSLDAEGHRVPLLQGDQALWAVYNDASLAGRESDPGGGSAGPLGVEVQHYVWGYARAGALGQTIFMRFKIINKGSNRLDSTFVSLWTDPDLGDASDDLVGCDTNLSLGYCYNAGTDVIYGDAAPAVGFDFFQGPIVPAEGDSAWVSGQGRYVYGYRNLPMYSFNKYINGTDPSVNAETYNYMLGLTKEGVVQTDPDGHPTTFAVSGDPVTGTGWLDDNPADRRFMMSAGPFTMSPGDTQEVVAAVLVGQGADRLASITALKRIDLTAQSVFDLNFRIPGPPPQPTVWAVPNDRAIQLLWGTEADGNVQYGLGAIRADGGRDTLQTFMMEGLNVWQGASNAGPWTKIATYDVNDGIQRIYDDVDNPDGKERVVMQHGTDNGLAHDLWITQDRVGGGSLVNNRPYYFSVTSYNYDDQNKTDYTIGPNSFGIISESFENLRSSPPEGVTPRSMTGVLADTLAASDTSAHVAGTSDGFVLIDFFDQHQITGDKYKVTFNTDRTWNLIDQTKGVTKLHDQSEPISSLPVDGMIVRVMGPPYGVKSVAEVANGDGPVDPPDNVNYSGNSTHEWYIDPQGDHGYGRYSWQGATDHDYELRWTPGATERCWDFFGQGDYSYVDTFRVPIEVWDITAGYRMTFMLIDDDNSGGWSWGDGIYFWDIHYDNVAWDTPGISTGDYDPDYAGLHYGRFWFFSLGDPVTGPSQPAPGTVVRVKTNKPNTHADVFEFTTAKPGTVEGTVVANTVDKVHPVPNPYYNVTALEKDQFSRQIKFVNLPPVRTTIRVFNLAGDRVRTLVHTDIGSAEEVWDVLTETGLPVASGLYIYYIEADGIGTKTGKLAVFTEVEQLNTY